MSLAIQPKVTLKLMKTFYFSIEHHTLKLARIEEPYGCEDAARNDLNQALKASCGGAARVKEIIGRKPKGAVFFPISSAHNWAEFAK